jgi:hypothetical protein
MVGEKSASPRKLKKKLPEKMVAPDRVAVTQEWLLAAADRSLRNPAHRHAKRVNSRRCFAYRRGDRLEKSR